MSAADAALVHALPGLAFALVLLLARIGGAVMLLPGIGEAALPPMVRAALALVLTALLFPVLLSTLPPAPATPSHLLAMLAAELMNGLWLGWLARVFVLSLTMAGDIISAMLGLANVILPNPAMGSEATALAQVIGVAAAALVLATGLYALPLDALVRSYHVIPAGTVLPLSDGTAAVVHGVGASFALGLRLAAPFVLGAIAWQMTLGLAARLVPQVPIYFVSLPGQILGGFVLLAGFAATLLALWLTALRAAPGLLPGLG